MNQRDIDSDRQVYRLIYPPGFKPANEAELRRSTSGTLRKPKWRFGAVPSVVQEVYGDARGIQHFTRLPSGHAAYIIRQLRLHGVSVEAADGVPDRPWNFGVELKMTERARQLWIGDEEAAANSILANFQIPDPEVAVMLQVISIPGGMEQPPPPAKAKQPAKDQPSLLSLLVGSASADPQDAKDRTEKASDVNFLVAIRIVAYAPTKAQAEMAVHGIESAIYARRSPATQLKRRRLVDISELRERVRLASTPSHFVIQLAAPELAALSAPAYNRPPISGLATAIRPRIPAASSIPTEGRKIGTSTFPGAERRVVALDYKYATYHSYVLGPAGRGKTTLLANMIAQDIEHGYGVIVIESKRDLFLETLKRVPDSRIEDVVVINIEDMEYPVGFNMFDQGSLQAAVDELVSLIGLMYASGSASILAPQVLWHTIHALSEFPGHTIIDLPVLLNTHKEGTPEAAWQKWIAKSVKNKDVRAYMERLLGMSDRERQTYILPVFNRIWEFTNRPEVKHLLGQRESSFQMTDIIRDNKILLVNLDDTRVGEGTASIIGTLLVNSVWRSVRMVKGAKPNFLYLDEFHDFVRLPVSVTPMFSKARSFGLGITAAHQNMAQIPMDIQPTVEANTSTKIYFEPAAKDAPSVARVLAGEVTADQLTHLGSHEVVVRTATDQGSSPVATVKTFAEGPDLGNAEKVKALSQASYGRPLEDVRRDIETLPSVPQPQHKQPPAPPQQPFDR